MRQAKFSILLLWNGFKRVSSYWVKDTIFIESRNGIYYVKSKSHNIKITGVDEAYDYLISSGICKPSPIGGYSASDFFMANGFLRNEGSYKRGLLNIMDSPTRRNEYIFNNKVYNYALLEKTLTKNHGCKSIKDILSSR